MADVGVSIPRAQLYPFPTKARQRDRVGALQEGLQMSSCWSWEHRLLTRYVRMMSLHPPKAQTVPKRPRDDIPTEGARYRLPILGPRTAVSHGLLSDAYNTLQDMQLSSLPRKEPVGKTMRQ
ncbi:uncharacterized protein C1orf105 homolog [Phocoena sinus]|uniref:uncharacterized protein C1orf105 homolog n=1 Tax=Phocoena sinus TaxID=42100 RepID=UPI0013C4639C|nr:uncharacterized protein C1orf105 homolog [Phocoena sinus]